MTKTKAAFVVILLVLAGCGEGIQDPPMAKKTPSLLDGNMCAIQIDGAWFNGLMVDGKCVPDTPTVGK